MVYFPFKVLSFPYHNLCDETLFAFFTLLLCGHHLCIDFFMWSEVLPSLSSKSPFIL